MPDTALTDGTVLTESFWTPNVRQQVITTCTSATRPTGVEGRYIHETDTELLYCHNGTGWEQVGGVGGWTSFTPQIDQGTVNIAKTVTYSKWTRGPRRTIIWTFNLALTATGAAGTDVTITIPVTAATSALVGVAQIFDTSTSTRYSSVLELASTTTAKFTGDWSGTVGWGTSPSLALASGDVLRGSITYEAAT
jgi:hypothetical protein